MKLLRRVLLGAGFLALVYLVHAQQAADSSQTATTTDSQILIPAMNPNGPVPSLANAFNGLQVNNVTLDITSVADLQTMLEALESQPPVPFASLPTNRRGQVFGGFWSLQNPYWPPLPGNVWQLDSWPIGNGNYILDDRQLDYNALQAAAEALTPTASPMMSMSMMASSLSTAYAYGNPVYLTNMAASFTNDGSITASFNIAGGTNFVPYDILTSTNLTIPVASWNWLGIGYTSNRYTFYEQPAALGFYILAKPSKTMAVGIGNDVVGQCDVPYGLTNALQVAGGGGQSIALKTDGTVVAWGANYYGEGVAPTNLTGVGMVAAGWYHNVAMLTNGTVTAWGFNLPSLGYTLTNVPANLTNAIVISAQALHTLALRSNGTVVAWGYNTSFGETNVPAGLTNVTAISAGYQFNLVVSNGFVVAWGDNTSGQCNVPAGLSNVVDVAAGTFHSLALLKNGTVVAWGDNFWGQTNVPVGLSNVVAIAAGGDPEADTAYSMALKNDGTMVLWGDDDATAPFSGLSNVFGIAAGADHALAVRTGPRTPVITVEPVDQYQLTNGTVTFTSRGAGLYGVTYQWQTNGVNLAGATNATLTVSNVQPAILGPYDLVVTANGSMGTIVSSNAYIHLVSTPVINSETLPQSQFVLSQSSLTLQVSASAPGQYNGFPLSYQWQFNGTNISGATSATYTFTAVNSGTYSVIVSNAAGSVSFSWLINVVYPGGVIGWGSNSNGQLNASVVLTNVISLAASKAQGIAALDSGSVSNWGSYWTGTNFVAVTAPPPFTNAFSVAAGLRHDLVLKTDGTVVAWGLNDFGQTNVPANATNVVAVAAGGQQSLALLKNQTVVQWGQTNAPIPAGLTNVTGIASGTNFNLVLLQNSTVAAWGANDYGQTNVPVGLSNVVAIAAGGAHALALKVDGTVVAWGAWTNVPAGLSNVLNVAAGENHNIALKNDGTVVAWGDNTFGQTNNVNGLNKVKLIAGGGDFTLAVQFSTTVMYPVDVTKDVLLIYNSNSTNSVALKDYYLAHRPMITGANVLGVACDVGELTTSSNYDNQIAAPVFNWYSGNPTKHPQYIVLFFDIPTRLSSYPSGYGSVGYNLHNSIAGIPPFVNNINANNLADCEAYVDKIAYMGTNFSPGKLVVSASAAGYGNTNYVLDDVKNIYCGATTVSDATNGLAASGVSSSSISYLNGCETTNNLPHITNAVNVAGYACWGDHSSLGGNYAINGVVKWSGNSGWWIMETVESFNGIRGGFGQGNFTQWFASNAFGGTNYSSTPVGAIGHTEEPGLPGVENMAVYFGLWAAQKNFAICAWNGRDTQFFQAIGDPLITK